MEETIFIHFKSNKKESKMTKQLNNNNNITEGRSKMNNEVRIKVEGYVITENTDWLMIENEIRKKSNVDTDGWKGIPTNHKWFDSFVYNSPPIIRIDHDDDINGFDIEDYDDSITDIMIDWVLKYFFIQIDGTEGRSKEWRQKSSDELPKVGNEILEVVK